MVAVPSSADRVRHVIVVGVLVAAAVVTLQVASQLIDFRIFDLRLWELNADKHYSLFGVASILAQATVAAASGWRGRRADRHRWPWFALAALVAALVLVRALVTYQASTLAVPLVCVFVLVCWLTWRDPGASRTVVWAALALIAISLLLHEVGPDADSSTASDFTWVYQITGVVKHGCELAGWMMIATGIIAGSMARTRRA